MELQAQHIDAAMASNERERELAAAVDRLIPNLANQLFGNTPLGWQIRAARYHFRELIKSDREAAYKIPRAKMHTAITEAVHTAPMKVDVDLLKNLTDEILKRLLETENA